MKRILFVDDEPNILQAVERQLRNRFEVRTALGPQAGLEAVEHDGPFAVVVSDFRMPHMNGTQFLAKVKQISPDTVRMMLTGQADLATAIDAVNEGQIFRFLTKPCLILPAALEAALEQYRLVIAERELLEKTLHGTIKVLTEVLSLINPGAFSRSCRVRQYVAHIASAAALPNGWELEVAAMLSQLGCVTIPEEVLDKASSGQTLSEAELEVLTAHSAVAERLLENIPRLESVAHMVRQQSQRPEPAEFAGLSTGDRVAVGAAVLRVALEFDRLIVAGATRAAAIEHMRAAGIYYSHYLEALETSALGHCERVVRMLKVAELDATMITNQDVYAANGLLLLRKGEELTVPLVARLRSFSKTMGVVQPISVVIQNQAHLS